MDIIELKPVNDFAASLISFFYKNFRDVANFISESVAKMMGVDRVSLIRSYDNGLILEGGFPVNGHGIGMKLEDEQGTPFLRKITENGTRIFILHPKEDMRVFYLRALIERFNIAGILFIPLYFGEENLGILAMDYVEGNQTLSKIKNSKEFSNEYFLKLRFIANHIVQAIIANEKYKKREEEIRRMERLAILGINAASFAHTTRNDLTAVGGFAKRILKHTEKCPDCKAGEYAGIVETTVLHLEKKVTEVLAFSRPATLHPEFCNLNEFLQNKITEFSHIFSAEFLKCFDKRLSRIHLAFDKQKLSDCLTDLVRNAIEAEAKKILIKTKLLPKSNAVSLSILNSGEKLECNNEELFAPFMTTKRNGTGLGLANVKAIVEAHGGNITANPTEIGGQYVTEFKITLPIGRRPQR